MATICALLSAAGKCRPPQGGSTQKRSNARISGVTQCRNILKTVATNAPNESATIAQNIV